MDRSEIRNFLEDKAEQFNHLQFIQDDPIQIPHKFSKKEDIEVIGFIISTIAWGNRKSIIKNGYRLIELMNNEPHQFTINYSGELLDSDFVHRTFNAVDLDFFIRALQNIYSRYGGLEQAFPHQMDTKDQIMHFRSLFLESEHEKRSEKHIANPASGSSAKRINMFLRWMIRKDQKGVDFGLWKKHDPAKLMIPLDVHTGKAARKLELMIRKQDDWKALEELMENLRAFDPIDPCKYDFALFGVSVNNELD
ncbi:MAG: TIGR02757 family protein [Crocinitomicaceae bacterium]